MKLILEQYILDMYRDWLCHIEQRAVDRYAREILKISVKGESPAIAYLTRKYGTLARIPQTGEGIRELLVAMYNGISLEIFREKEKAYFPEQNKD